ncbi:MAG: D-arabinono-1,4-lactone oxidase [Acidimicrobiales bacterium]
MPTRRKAPRAWSNWAGTEHVQPEAVAHPVTTSDIVEAVRDAARRGRRVKAVGSGHSFTGVAVTDGVQLLLDRHRRLIDIDRERGLVTVEAGMKLHRLSQMLAGWGLALANLGDIAVQTVAGAVATGTHGTGAALGGLASQIRGMELVLADGSVLRCSAAEEPEVFTAARVSLGALGIMSQVTLQAVPAFNLRAVEAVEPLDRVLEGMYDDAASNDHFEFYAVPHTGMVRTKRNNRTGEPPGGRGRAGELRDRVLLENVAFGALCRIGRRVPALVPRLARVSALETRVEYVERSYKVFASPRWVRFVELEYELPAAEVRAALTEVLAAIDERGFRISFPIEVRFTAADDIPLSTASDRESGYIAVHQYRGVDYQAYFAAVERIMVAHGGRPHWGKMHTQDAAGLAPRYPHWDEFIAQRDRLDPEGRFANPYLDRVLGPVT